ncbi:MAG: tRNA (adenosine(37)-N6)-dimethylallyltransferase MiaA [Alphaproteobacteria bacterium]|nr:tRNA (adenosine(37)-N6)-dimethylallyltransferase MiaA [Alphaproteobacteria bacterium]
MQKPIPIIVGPTASGKSKFSIAVAKRINGEIINADSLQVYKDIQILSARPTQAEQEGIPHHLYGYMNAFETSSVMGWLKDVEEIIKNIKNPVFVGGTGLYVKALVEGISPMPDIPPEIREQVRNMDIEEVKTKVKECVAIDPQRLRRALEVELTTGKSFLYFQNQKKIKLIDKEFQIFFLNPPRNILYERCDKRFIKMLTEGAIEEVKYLNSINANGGITKAIGIKQISKWLKGEISNQEMIEDACKETRHYAKRQITWFKNQFKDKITFTPEQISDILNSYF